jgi:hypothetical protein
MIKTTRRRVLAMIGLAPAAALVSFRSSDSPRTEADVAQKLVDAGIPVDHAVMAFNKEAVTGRSSGGRETTVYYQERRDCTFELELNGASKPLEPGDAFRAIAGSIEMDYVVTSATVSARTERPVIVEYEGFEVTRGTMEIKAVLDVRENPRIYLDRRRLKAENAGLARGRLL